MPRVNVNINPLSTYTPLACLVLAVQNIFGVNCPPLFDDIMALPSFGYIGFDTPDVFDPHSYTQLNDQIFIICVCVCIIKYICMILIY